jgi:hypothetical protein
MTNFFDTRILDAAQTRALLQPVVSRYDAQAVPYVGGPVTLSLSIRTPLSEIWAATPREGHAEYLRLAAKVSVAIQECLRAWLPYLWFADITRFDDFDTAGTLASYAALRPFTPKNKQAYAFDVLDGDTPRAVKYWLKRWLGPYVAPMEQMLLEMGRACSRNFAPRRAERILALYERKPHPLHSLLVIDRDLVEEFVGMRAAHAEPEALEKSRLAIERRLRRGPFHKDVSFLMPLLEIEAARAAAQVAGIDPGFRFQANFEGSSALLVHEDNVAISDLDAASAVLAGRPEFTEIHC